MPPGTARFRLAGGVADRHNPRVRGQLPRLARIPAALTLVLAIATTLAGAVPASAAVLYVGDSLGVGTVPYLRQQLGSEEIDDDVETGRPSSSGIEILRSRIGGGYDTVVFDLGTNDDPAAPDALAADLQEARQIAGDSCLVVATLNRPPLNGVSVDGLNAAVEKFASSTPGVALVDWHQAAESQPGLLFDGVHAQPEGYQLRAQLFAQAIQGCAPAGLATGSGGSGGGGTRTSHPRPSSSRSPTRLPSRSRSPSRHRSRPTPCTSSRSSSRSRSASAPSSASARRPSCAASWRRASRCCESSS